MHFAIELGLFGNHSAPLLNGYKFSLVKASFKKRDVVEKMKNYLVCDGFSAYKARNPEAQ